MSSTEEAIRLLLRRKADEADRPVGLLAHVQRRIRRRHQRRLALVSLTAAAVVAGTTVGALSLASIFHGKSRDTGVEKPKVPALQGKMGLSKSPTTLAERHLVDAE